MATARPAVTARSSASAERPASGALRPAAPTLTEQQRAAIYTRDVSIALAAGAGCGKTFVLTERFLAALDPTQHAGLNPPELDELIAFTFTERAAREMRDRIRSKCAERLRAAADGDVPYWTALLRSLDAARIVTIHGFCSALLKSHAVEARLDPAFNVLDQTPAQALLTEATDDVFRRRLTASDEATLNLAVLYGIEGLKEIVGELLAARQNIDFEAALAETPEEIVARWAKYHRATAIPCALASLVKSPQARTMLEVLSTNVPSHAVMQERRAVLLDLLPNLASSRAPAADLELLRASAMVQGAGSKKNWDDEATYERYKKAASKLRDEIDSILPQLEFDAAAAIVPAQIGLQALGLAHEVANEYERLKFERSAVDFNDLLLYAHRLLTKPESESLRRGLAKRLHLLLVDEFQDTDPLQVELVEALCGDDLQRGKLFFVGDFKQSIYRFRGADPSVFRRLQSEVPAAGQLQLTLNFRSQPAILDFVNALFAGEFGDDYAPLRAHRPQLTATPSIEFLWSSIEAGPDEPQKLGKDETRRREAQSIARRLRAMLDRGEQLVVDAKTKQPRPVRPGDIAILFRALSNVAIYEQALQDAGIDYYLVGGHAFYAQQEIFDLLNLLRAVASSVDDVSLAGVLRSPFFSLSDETLFWLAQQGALSAAVMAARLPAQLEPEQAARVRFAAETLRTLRAKKDRLPIAELMNQALALTGYDAVLLAEFLGQRKLANLRKLIQQARALDRSGQFTLDDFIAQLSQYVVRQPHEALAATHPESTDVVRLMTIHQSKGLEFPVVVVVDVDRQSRSSSSRTVVSRELGAMVRMPGTMGEEGQHCGYQLHQLVTCDEEQQELVRLFYVAATRAADYLILSSAIDLEKANQSWTRVLAGRFDLKTGELLAPLPADWPIPSVRVTHGEDLAPVAGEQRPRPNLEAIVAEAETLAAGKKPLTPPTVAPVLPDVAGRRRYSFSRLRGDLHVATAVPPRDDDSQPQATLDPLGLGTLVHNSLEELDYAEPGDLGALVRHQADQLPGKDWAAEIDVATDILQRFVRSPRFRQIAQSIEVYRELDFMLAWPPDAPAPNGPYLQGVLDCLYRGDDRQWRLVDFKTNHVTPKTLSEVAANYRMQMGVYALAVEAGFGQAPVSLTLHFLRNGLEYHFSWNDAARSELRQTIDEAIQRAIAQATEEAARSIPQSL